MRADLYALGLSVEVSMKSGLEDRNNAMAAALLVMAFASQ